MKTTEKTITLGSGLTIRVKREYGYTDRSVNADGDIVSLGSKFYDSICVYLSKGDIKAFLRDLNFLYVLDTNSPHWQDAIQNRGAYARFGDITVTKDTYEAILDLIDQVRDAAEVIEEPEDVIKDEPAEEDFVVNPAYANMTREELSAAESSYDNLQNEGTKEGYNPYRDALFIER